MLRDFELNDGGLGTGGTKRPAEDYRNPGSLGAFRPAAGDYGSRIRERSAPPADRPFPMPFAARSHAPRSKPLSVVVADDVVEIQKLVEHWLSDVGCNVTCASSGNEVAKLVRARHFDVVITDVIMPDGDGLEVIADLKRTLPKARVLAISGGGNHLPAHDCLKFAKSLGAHAVLLKPFNRTQLLEAVTKVAQGDPPADTHAPGGSHPGA